MLSTTLTVLSGLVAVAAVSIGVRAFWVPEAATGFGIPDTPTRDPAFRAWLAVKAVRDVACGLSILVAVVATELHLLGWFMVVAGLIPVGDAVIVLLSRGPKSTVFAVHGATALVMLTVGLLALMA